MCAFSSGSSSPSYHRVNLVLETHEGITMPSPRSNYCTPCIYVVKWLPVLFILAIIGWSYFAYVVELCFLTVHSYIERILLLIFYHLVLFIFLWAYWQTVFTDIGRVPRQFKLPIELVTRYEAAEEEEQQRILNEFAVNLPLENCGLGGGVRYCEKCQHIKPDRAHHCGVCGVCVLKMDHHCPWVNNCVGFTSYKFFILFLFYSLIYCIFIFCTTMPYFIQFWKGGVEGGSKFHVLFLFFIAVMFSISLFALFGYHCYLVIRNRSTLESFRAPMFRMGPDKNGFSLGSYNNFIEVFGSSRRKWFLPLFTSLGDGVVYPTQLQPSTVSYSAMTGP